MTGYFFPGYTTLGANAPVLVVIDSLLGKQVPEIESCPEDITVYTEERAVEVSWDIPEFSDYGTVTSNYEPG